MKTTQQNAPLNILLADDDTDDRALFAKALTEIPIATHLTTVNDGEELMKHLNENSENLPDVLFLDLIMPRKSGLESLSEIKENAKLKDIHVVMFSASYDRGIDFELDVKNLFYKKGAQEYIRKSADFEKFTQSIHNGLIKATENKYNIALMPGKNYEVTFIAPNYMDTAFQYRLKDFPDLIREEKNIILKPKKKTVVLNIKDSETKKGLGVKIKITNLDTGEEIQVDNTVGRDGKYAVNFINEPRRL